jgi:hypothetical protein
MLSRNLNLHGGSVARTARDQFSTSRILQNFLLFVSVQLPLAGTSPPLVLTAVLNRPLIRSIGI